MLLSSESSPRRTASRIWVAVAILVRLATSKTLSSFASPMQAAASVSLLLTVLMLRYRDSLQVVLIQDSRILLM